MRIAESLYMNGLVSYPRVDNTVYPPSLDLRGILGCAQRGAGVPGYAQRLLGAGAEGHARQEGDDRPPADPPDAAADPTSSSPRSSSCTT
jgi:DNA topoisomerase I